MKLTDEVQILDIDIRAQILEEIEGPENISRKEESLRRYECFKDFTKKYVLQRIESEMGADTAIDVRNRVSNISFTRKVVDKRAGVYRDGVKRILIDQNGKRTDDSQEQVGGVYRLVNANSQMKKTNKFSELQKNCLVFAKPYQCSVSKKWKYKLVPLQSYLYDVIEDANDPEKPLIVIFSYFTSRQPASISSNPAGIVPTGQVGAHYGKPVGFSDFRLGDKKDQTIADSPSDEGEAVKEYVWWSHNFHFTTDQKGNIIKAEENLENPIRMLPFVDFSMYQDGNYWALGGDDLIDGSILLNLLLTDLYYIARYQGFGVFYAFGKNIPEKIKIGPREGIILKVNEGEPTPQVGFATPSTQIDMHMQMIEQYLALLLSTNNLEPNEITGQLSATNAQSGIQEIIKKSVNTDDIEDQQQIYKDGEPRLFNIIRAWHNLYLERGQLDEEFAQFGRIDENLSMILSFNKPQAYMTETEKLDLIQKRKDMGLDTMLDSIMRDNQEMTMDEAKERLKKILEEKLIESSMKMREMIKGKIGEVENGSEQSDVRATDSDEDNSEE